MSFSLACFSTNLTIGQSENFKMPTVSTETSSLRQPVSRYSSLCGIGSLILISKKVNKQFFPEFDTISCDYYQYYLEALFDGSLC